jgi:CRISPR-associated endonuclease/helicase Cas3
MTVFAKYEELFKKAVGVDPFPFQERFALCNSLPQFLNIPTGCGKTETVIMGWLWRRRFSSDEIRRDTPRRLIYCLPMRVLVEQTMERTKRYLENIEQELMETGGQITSHILMGGDTNTPWDLYPENDSIIIGTQDMLLSRALNRGYAMSRYRWPLHFGFMNNDCLWVMDETQLMGSGLSTTSQLQAFRNMFGSYGPVGSIWMSATLQPEQIETVDFKFPMEPAVFKIDANDMQYPEIEKRINARKPINKIEISSYPQEVEPLTEIIAFRHVESNKKSLQNSGSPSLTLVMVNTVDRAVSVYEKLSALVEKGGSRPEVSKKHGSHPDNIPDILLLHSRFRPAERGIIEKTVSQPPTSAGFPSAGRIIVSTQVVEAGMDIDARLLITDIAPWSSLVQRFGRCNRRGNHKYGSDEYAISWLDILSEKNSAPYTTDDFDHSRKRLADLKDASPSELDRIIPPSPPPHTHVIRKKDIIELFDTTPDLAGADIDVSRYIRDGDSLDVSVYWKGWDTAAAPPDDMPGPLPAELCPVPVSRFLEFLKSKHGKTKNSDHVFIWNPLDNRWVKPQMNAVTPGMIFLIGSKAGGYHPKIGWSPGSISTVVEVPITSRNSNEGYATHNYSFWQSLKDHSDETETEIRKIADELSRSISLPTDNLLKAARLHDYGKAHPVFQAAVTRHLDKNDPKRSVVWAKSPGVARYERPLFRHELPGALALIQHGFKDLVVYLVAAHHGKIRASIRSLPGEKRPDDEERFARGTWEGDTLQSVEMGDGISFPDMIISLEPMEMGLSPEGAKSWCERVLALRDSHDLGLFRLSFLEGLVKCADERASTEKIVKDGEENE